MEIFNTDDLLREQEQARRPYHEFLRVPALSGGLYHLPAGSTDPQQPHTEDEVYVVMRGRAWISVGDEDMAVTAGSIVYVAAHVPHRFHTIEEDLVVLVFFAPAEYSLAPEAG